MIMKVTLLAIAAALLAVAAPNKQQCSNALDVSDTTCKVVATPGPFQPALFNISKWIWTGENPVPGGVNPVGTRAMRKNITAPCGKCAVCATIVIASDDSHTVYVNGVNIGTAGFAIGQVLYTALKPSSNIFAIEVVNDVGIAGVVATILVHYSDGSRESFITDETWRTLPTTPPTGFQLPSFDDSQWGFAASQGTFQTAPFHSVDLPPALPLSGSNWIWTSDNVNGAAPAGSRAFRKTVNDCTKVAVCATAVIAADNHYTLYVNGETVGNGSSFTAADAYTIPNLRPAFNTFAINATNDAGPAGVIATILITYTDGSNETVVTDSSWKAFRGLPQGFEEPFVDESTWENATVVGAFGVPPWGSNIAIPPA